MENPSEKPQLAVLGTLSSLLSSFFGVAVAIYGLLKPKKVLPAAAFPVA